MVRGLGMSLRMILQALYLGICLTVAARAGELSPLLPADAQLAVTSPHMNRLATAWAGCALGKMVQGDDLKPFHAELESNDVGSLLRLRPWFGWDWAELAEVPGAVTLGIFPSNPAGAAVTAAPQPEYVCLLAKDSDDTAVVACRTAGEAYFKKLGVTPTTKQIGKVACASFMYKPKSGPARTTVYFATEQFLGAATSLRGAELVLSQLAKNAEPITPATEQGLATFAIEPLPLAKLLSLPPAKGKRNYVKFFERQGGAAIQLLSGSLDLPAEGPLELAVNAELQGTFPLPKGLGILNYQAAKPTDLSDDYGKSPCTIRHWNWDFPEAMKALAHLFDEWNEPGPRGVGLFDDMIDGLRDDPEGPQVDLRKGLFTQLGPRVREVTINSAKNQSPPRQHKITMIDCRDAAAVKQTLEKYYKSDKQVSKDMVNGAVIWHVPPGKTLFVEGQSKSSQNFEAATVQNKVLYLADDYEALLAYFKARAAPADAAVRARFVAVDKASLAVAGATVGYRSLSLGDLAWRIPYEKLQADPVKDEAMNVALLRWLLCGAEASRPVGLGKTLPAWSKLQPLAPPTFNILNPETNGMRWQSGMLRVPK